MIIIIFNAPERRQFGFLDISNNIGKFMKKPAVNPAAVFAGYADKQRRILMMSALVVNSDFI